MAPATFLLTSCLVVGGIAVISAGIEPAGASIEERYECRIQEAYRLSDDGTLESGAWKGDPRGDSFVVSRESGRITGEWLTTLRAASTEVTQGGNGEWSFQAIARFPNGHGVQVQSITIQQFASGDEKPFVAYAMGGIGVASGLCVLR